MIHDLSLWRLGLCPVTLGALATLLLWGAEPRQIGVVKELKGEWRDASTGRTLKPSSQIYDKSNLEDTSRNYEDFISIRFNGFEGDNEIEKYSCEDGTTCTIQIDPNASYQKRLDRLNSGGVWTTIRQIARSFLSSDQRQMFTTLSPPTRSSASEQPAQLVFTSPNGTDLGDLFSAWSTAGLSDEWHKHGSWKLEWCSMADNGRVSLPPEPNGDAIAVQWRNPYPASIKTAVAPGLYFAILDFEAKSGDVIRSGYRAPALVLPAEKRAAVTREWEQVHAMAAQIKDPLEEKNHLVAGLIYLRQRYLQ